MLYACFNVIGLHYITGLYYTILYNVHTVHAPYSRHIGLLSDVFSVRRPVIEAQQCATQALSLPGCDFNILPTLESERLKRSIAANNVTINHICRENIEGKVPCINCQQKSQNTVS